jgi:hypothetical protein
VKSSIVSMSFAAVVTVHAFTAARSPLTPGAPVTLMGLMGSAGVGEAHSAICDETVVTGINTSHLTPLPIAS